MIKCGLLRRPRQPFPVVDLLLEGAMAVTGYNSPEVQEVLTCKSYRLRRCKGTGIGYKLQG